MGTGMYDTEISHSYNSPFLETGESVNSSTTQDHVLDNLLAACQMEGLLADGSAKWDFTLDKLSPRVNTFICLSPILRDATKRKRI
jgi:hypothetical protein